MSFARIVRQSALTLGLVFTFIGLGQASTPMPTANLSPARSAETAAAPLSAETLSQQILASVSTRPSTPQPTELPAANRARIQGNFGKLPLSFIENQGQADERIAYYIQSPNRSLYFTRDGHALRLTPRQRRRGPGPYDQG